MTRPTIAAPDATTRASAAPPTKDWWTAACLQALHAGAIETHDADLLKICPPERPKDDDATGLVAAAVAQYHFGKFFARGDAKGAAFARGVTLAERATRATPERAEPWFWLGALTAMQAKEDGALAQLGSLKDVRDWVTRSAAIDPTYLDAGAVRVRGRVYFLARSFPLSIGDVDKARVDLERAVVLGPRSRLNALFLAELVVAEDGCAAARPLLARLAVAPRTSNRYEEADNDAMLTRLTATCPPEPGAARP